MMKACKTAFIVGFEKCKSMIQAHLPNVSVEFLHANLLDKSLGAARMRVLRHS